MTATIQNKNETISLFLGIQVNTMVADVLAPDVVMNITNNGIV